MIDTKKTLSSGTLNTDFVKTQLREVNQGGDWKATSRKQVNHLTTDMCHILQFT